MEFKKLLTKRNIIIFVFIVVIAVFAYTFYNRTQLILISDKQTFEYGTKIDLDIKNFLELDQNQGRRKDILENTKMKNDFVFEKGQDYPKVGEYNITLTLREMEKIVKVTIQDSTPPQMNSPKSIQMLQGAEIKESEFKKYFYVQDLSETNLSFDISQYDKNKVGKQVIEIKAKDIHDNITTTKYTIETIEKPDVKRYTTKTIVDKDNNQKVSKVYIQKTEKPFQLDVKLYCQHDVGARMGCDPAALYQAMKYKGYCQNVSLKTFIQDMPLSKNNNPNYGFAGNPFGKNEPDILETIYPSPMASWAKKYGKVSDFSGRSVDDIINELRKNNPVVVYVTYNFKAPKWQNWHFGRMYNNLHCFTASGYNPETKQIRLSDPGGARRHVWVSLSTFTKSYNYKKFAVVVR